MLLAQLIFCWEVKKIDETGSCRVPAKEKITYCRHDVSRHSRRRRSLECRLLRHSTELAHLLRFPPAASQQTSAINSVCPPTPLGLPNVPAQHGSPRRRRCGRSQGCRRRARQLAQDMPAPCPRPQDRRSRHARRPAPQPGVSAGPSARLLSPAPQPGSGRAAST